MIDAVLAGVITVIITSTGTLLVSLVNHLKSSKCWGISAEFSSTTQPTNTSTNKS